MKFAVQLYSLRFFIEEYGIDKAFEIIKNAGFEGVEFAGFYGMRACEIRNLLDKYSLQAVAAHVGVDDIEEQLPILKELGIKYSVIPYLPFNISISFEEGVELCKKAERLLKRNGVEVVYHNHAHEFNNGTDIISGLVRNIPKLRLELDVFWLAAAEIKATDYMLEHKDKLQYLHLKELGKNAEDFNPVLGEGQADIKNVIKLGKQLGVEWSILEVEKVCIPMAEYLQKCYGFIKNFT